MLDVFVLIVLLEFLPPLWDKYLVNLIFYLMVVYFYFPYPVLQFDFVLSVLLVFLLVDQILVLRSGLCMILDLISVYQNL